MSIAKSSILVSIFTVLGMGLGLLSNTVVAMKFGAGADMDVFLAATTIPLFITSILTSVLSFTFIPVFADYKANDPGEIWKVVSGFMNLSVIVTAALCLLFMVFALPATRLLVRGFTPEKLEHAAGLLRWLMPIIVLTAVNELMASVYYSTGRFAAPSLNKIISPVVTMAYVLLFHNSLSTKSIALAMLTAAFLQTLILAAGFFKDEDFHYIPFLDCSHPGMKKMFNLMTPLLLGMIIYRAVPVFDRYFLSGLPEGSISHVVYAVKLASIIPAVLGSGITISVFPLMSKYAAERDFNSLRNIMSKGIRMLFFLSLPVAVFLAVFGVPVIRLLFERGLFTAADTRAVYHALVLYMLALPAMTIGSVIGQGYYVLKDTTTAALVGVGEMALYILLCLLALPRLGYLAIPAAYALYLNIGALLNALIVRSKIGDIGGAKVMGSMLRHLAAAITPLPFIFLFFRFNNGIAVSMLLIACCFAVYLLVSKFIFATEEIDDVLKQLKHTLRKIGVSRPGRRIAAP